VRNMAAKGGPRRLKVPPTDLGHLEDLLADVLRKEGEFNFRSYRTVLRTQAVVGSDLAVLTSFIEKLMLAQPMLLFKYQELKQVYQKIVMTYPSLQQSQPDKDSSEIAKKLAEQTMTLACHARRLRDPVRFKECTKNLYDWQVQKLQTLREELQRLHEDYEEEQKELQSSKAGKGDEKVKGQGGSVIKSPGILKKSPGILKKPSTVQSDFDSFMETLELPATSADESMSCPRTPSKILLKAEETSPVPSRKKTLKQQIAMKKLPVKKMPKPKKSKKTPGKGLVKEKKEEKNNKDGKKTKEKKMKTKDMVLTSSDRDKLFLMPYRKTG
ncbi:unnamed protein product, partial [Symbiodinium sp. CCMP2456]